MEQEMVPEVAVADANPNPDAAAMRLTGDTQTDLRNIAQEMGVSLDDKGNVAGEHAPQPEATPVRQTPAAARPQMPPAAKPKEDGPQADAQPPEVEVPPKFQTKEGEVDESKIDKSKEALKAKIEEYRNLEKEFGRLQNRVNNQPKDSTPQQTQQQPQLPQNLSPLEVQIAEAIIQEHRTLGAQITEAQAIALARVQAKALEARYDAEMSATESLRQRLEERERAEELQSLAQDDPWILTDEATKTLAEIRRTRPWINQAPDPWREAYIYHRGKQGPTAQVKTPNPTGATARAPVPPVGPVPRVQQGTPTSPAQMTDDQLAAEIKRLYPQARLR